MFILRADAACDVCLDPYSEIKQPAVIRCGHVFCKHCLYTLPVKCCPICRDSFSVMVDMTRILVDLAPAPPVERSTDEVALEKSAVEAAKSGNAKQMNDAITRLGDWVQRQPTTSTSAHPMQATLDLLKLLAEATSQLNVALDHASSEEQRLLSQSRQQETQWQQERIQLTNRERELLQELEKCRATLARKEEGADLLRSPTSGSLRKAVTTSAAAASTGANLQTITNKPHAPPSDPLTKYQSYFDSPLWEDGSCKPLDDPNSSPMSGAQQAQRSRTIIRGPRARSSSTATTNSATNQPSQFYLPSPPEPARSSGVGSDSVSLTGNQNANKQERPSLGLTGGRLSGLDKHGYISDARSEGLGRSSTLSGFSRATPVLGGQQQQLNHRDSAPAHAHTFSWRPSVYGNNTSSTSTDVQHTNAQAQPQSQSTQGANLSRMSSAVMRADIHYRSAMATPLPPRSYPPPSTAPPGALVAPVEPPPSRSSFTSAASITARSARVSREVVV